GRPAGRVPDPLDGVGDLDDVEPGGRRLLLDEAGDAVTLGDELVAHEVEERAGPDGLVVWMRPGDGEVEPAGPASEAALRGDGVEVQAVAAADLGDERELRGEPQDPRVRALGLRAAVLHEAVEHVAVFGGSAG